MTAITKTMTPTRFIMDTVIVILPFGIFLAIYLYRKNKDISISKVPGPPSTSWYGEFFLLSLRRFIVPIIL